MSRRGQQAAYKMLLEQEMALIAERDTLAARLAKGWAWADRDPDARDPTWVEQLKKYERTCDLLKQVGQERRDKETQP